MTSHDSFDFLFLPRELRDEIYRLVLLPTSNLFPPHLYNTAPIVTVSKQINQEAQHLLSPEAIIHVNNRLGPINGPHRQTKARWLVSKFRHIRLDFHLAGPPDENKEIFKWTNDHQLFSDMFIAIRQASRSHDYKARVTLFINFSAQPADPGHEELQDPLKWSRTPRQGICETMDTIRKHVTRTSINVILKSKADEMKKPTREPFDRWKDAPAVEGWPSMPQWKRRHVWEWGVCTLSK